MRAMTDGNGGADRITAPIAGPLKLEVEPSKARAAQQVFLRAVDKLRPMVLSCYERLRIEPWLGDPASKQAAKDFTRILVDSDNSLTKQLELYQQRLQAIADALGKIADDFERTDQAGHDMFQGQHNV
jgi:hypothetical protein